MSPKISIAAALIALAACTQQPQAASSETAAPATAWTRENEAALTEALGTAERHALNRDDYLGPLARAGPGQRDAALRRAALAYAQALARGRADPARLSEHYSVPRPGGGADLGAGLDRALAGNGLAGWLAGLAPQDDEYRALSEAYVQANAQLAAAEGRPAPALVDRARTLAVNLERRRWLERTPPGTRIDVNTGAATLIYWRDGRAADTRRVVVGEPGNETPELGSPLYRLVANPTWTVPRSIQEEEIEPKGEAYMRRQNMEWRDGWIVQQPGPRNSLGLVKFDLQNDQAIYLHDTPAKSLFGEAERHASHGCVRVQDALGFARMIAQDAGVLDDWNEARAKGDEAFVPLPRPIPVRLLYHTAFVANGRVTIVPDAYGWDEDVAEALGLPARPRRAAQRRARDLGP
ncbi:MAG TPA: L,D-transpeptidase family protein [Allosphingosinicella sp.]|nr:L,D-transpeptidase family protein [Allosphingosinicella sp.]